MKALALLALVLAVLYCLSSASAPAHNVTGHSTLSAERIDSILCSAVSPACGTGRALYADSLTYGINDAYALAFFDHESSYGTQGIARQTRSLGNIKCSTGYRCIAGFRAYSSWQEGYADWYKLIKYYVDTLGKKSLEAIVPTYAPASENDVAAYINAINRDVGRWQ